MTPLLIACGRGRGGKINILLDKYSHSLTRSFAQVLELESGSNDNGQENGKTIVALAEQLCSQAMTNQCSIVIDKSLVCPAWALGGLYDLVAKVPFTTIIEAQKKNRGRPFIQNNLNSLGLSSARFVEQKIRTWNHGSVSGADVDSWLKQFYTLKIGNVGEGILGLVNVVSTSEVGDLLSDQIPNSRCAICMLSDPETKGKSAEVLLNIVRKRFKNAEIFDNLSDALLFDPKYPLHVVEDGLFSATEMIGLFESLLGRRPASRKNKIPPLKNTNAIKERSIQINFAAGCDFGIKLLESYFKQFDLNNISIKIPKNKIFNLLTLKGADELERSGDFVRLKSVGLSSGGVIPHAFSDHNYWNSKEDREKAIEACKSIGEQLTQAYSERQTKNVGWEVWPRDRIIKDSLGRHGFGLTMSFSHSIPKASLPLLWGEGSVIISGHKIEWTPLFINAN